MGELAWRTKIYKVWAPEVKSALDLLEPYISPKWIIPQFRHSVENEQQPLEKREGQQQVLRAAFPGIRNCVRELLGIRTDALARKFHETHDMAVKHVLERLLKEYGNSESRGTLGPRQKWSNSKLPSQSKSALEFPGPGLILPHVVLVKLAARLCALKNLKK